MKIHLFIVVIAMLTLGGCLHKRFSSRLIQISLGMTKDAVIDKLGEPNAVRGSIINKFGQTIELWEYEMVGSKFLAPSLFEIYWLYFYDNKLVQWGRTDDWQKTADNIHEIRFK